MPHTEIAFAQTVADDPSPLFDALRAGLDRPLLLWAHPGIGQAAVVEAAAQAAGLHFRAFDAGQFESWDGFRDVSSSGHFRELSIEKFLAGGELADPGTFTLAAGEVLYLRGLNGTPTRLLAAVFDQILDEHKLLNNPLPDDLRIVASVQPPDRQMALELLGPELREVWNGSRERATLKYPTFPLPARVVKGARHWALLPSVPRFLSWGIGRKHAPEVLRFLEDAHIADRADATTMLHAALLHRSEPFPQLASPRAFADLGSLLSERRPYFSSRAVKDALASAANAEEFQAWLHAHLATWDADRWIECDSSMTLKGEPVTGAVWLKSVIEQVRDGVARIGLDDLPSYAASERRSLEMWATQELGDDLGSRFVGATAVTAAEVVRLNR